MRDQALLYLAALDARRARSLDSLRTAADEIVQSARTQPGPRFLPLHQLLPDERFVRARAHPRRVSRCCCKAPRRARSCSSASKTLPRAVLFATSSFWQGVDVPGEQLSCVIVDRLPFAVPSDPIVAARVRALQEDGRNPFAEFQVPQAVLALKQGFGRLIRTKTDRGVLALLDTRIQRMPYGKIFLESLPPYRITHDSADAARFLEQR